MRPDVEYNQVRPGLFEPHTHGRASRGHLASLHWEEPGFQEGFAGCDGGCACTGYKPSSRDEPTLSRDLTLCATSHPTCGASNGEAVPRFEASVLFDGAWTITGYTVERGYGSLEVATGTMPMSFEGLLFSRLPIDVTVSVVRKPEGVYFYDRRGEFATGGISRPYVAGVSGRR